jgi:hypothetical protein
MPKSDYEETTAVAHLPQLDIEIRHRRPWQGEGEGGGEELTITVRAAPSFEAFGRVLEAANPMLFWMRWMQAAWAPWLAFGGATRPRRIADD